jgi:cell division protein FtsQ
MEWTLPHGAGVKALALFAAATAVSAMIAGGHVTTVISALTSWGGLGISEIRISGQSEASEVEILDRLAIGQYPSLLTFDVDAAKSRVETLPWVERATLRKFFPNGLDVSITERRPFALWQHDDDLSLVDDTGKVITKVVDDSYARLPFVVGPGAAERAGEFVALISGFPDIAKQVRAGVLISARRWTIVLENGVELMLPVTDPAKALSTIASLDTEKGLLSRQIAAVDMRLPGQLIVRLNADGLAERDKMLKDRDKLQRRMRTNT